MTTALLIRQATFLLALGGTVYQSVKIAGTLPHAISTPEEIDSSASPPVGIIGDRHLKEDIQLTFGFEMEYLFPNTTVHTIDQDDEARERLDAVKDALATVNLTGILFVHKDDAKESSNKDAWKIVREWAGFELVSPALSTLQPVRDAMSAMTQHGVGTHVLRTNFHTSIDATNRTIDQVRHVYKNFMAVEEALDTLRDCPQRADHSYKSLSIRQQFRSLQEGYDVLDTCGDDYDCLVESAESVASKYDNYDYFHQMNLRYDWEEIGIDSRNNNTLYYTWPERIEFRGQMANTDEAFVTAWIQLMHNMVKSSFDGIVLEPIDRTVAEAWGALFDELIRDQGLRHYFERQRLRICPGCMQAMQ